MALDDEYMRKSVTFQDKRLYHSWDDNMDPDNCAMENADPVPRPSKLHLDRLDASNGAYRRGSSGIIDTKAMKNRSRSVIIRLQVPRGSPTTAKKSIEEGDEDEGFRERALTYSGSTQHQFSKLNRTQSPKMMRRQLSPLVSSPKLDRDKSPSPSSSATNLAVESEDDDLADLSPTLARKMMHQHVYSSRRNSFLYQSDNEDAPSNVSSTNPVSRTSSVSSHINDETYVTPYAQILANLYRVRSQFITLTQPSIPEERRRSRSWEMPPQANLPKEEYQTLALSTLDELDWCLHRLETVNSAKSVGNMAQDKFKRLLSRELSHMSERSRSGHFVAEWVNTITGNNQDKSDEIDKVLQSISTVDTLKPDLRTRSTSVSEQVSRFGLTNPVLNEDKLQEFIDTSMPKWEFDAFQMNYLTNGQPLVACAYTVFMRRGLFVEFKISKQIFVNFMSAIENNYWKKNPYHNSIHACDVLHAVNFLLNASALENIFSQIEVLAVLIAAAVHDVDHPGRNNQFLINSSNELAIMYNDESILENHHLAVTFKLLQEPTCNFLSNLEKTQMKALRKVIIDTVLATDMSKHFQHLGELKTMVETKKVANDGILQVDKYSDRSEILQCLLHCSDLSNPAKPAEIAGQWAERIMEESFNQGDEEKKLQLDISPLGDRENVRMEKCQVSFIDYIVYPLWETWAELVYPDAQHIMDHLSQTREHWYQLSLRNSPPLSDEDKGSASPVFNEPDNSKKEEQADKLMSPKAHERRTSFKATKYKELRDDL